MKGIKCGCVFLELAEQSKTGNTYNWKDKLSIPLSLDDILNLSYNLENKLESVFIINNIILTVSDSSLSMYSSTAKIFYIFTLNPSLTNDLSHSLKQAKFVIHGWV